MVTRFRSRARIIDAVQFEDTQGSVDAIASLATGCILRVKHTTPGVVLMKLETPDFLWLGTPGDWVIRHGDGEIEVCSEAAFGALYEPCELLRKGAET